jgi:DNA polymerase-3 subunit epsilon
MCSQKLAQEAFADLFNYRLSDVAQYLGLDLDHHDALADARVAAEIAIRSIPKIRHSDLSLNHEELTFNIEKIPSQETKDIWTNLFGNKKIDRQLLRPDLNVEHKENAFYNKRVVFTGDLTSINRQEAAERIRNLGADINTSIGRRTDIVIVGQRPGPSKMKKISNLMDMGYNIRLIDEDEFLALLAKEMN